MERLAQSENDFKRVVLIFTMYGLRIELRLSGLDAIFLPIEPSCQPSEQLFLATPGAVLSLRETLTIASISVP